MPISVTKVVPYKHVFEQDPDGASWVEILPVTERMEQRRGQLLATQEIGYDEAGYMTRRVIANSRDVENMELFLSFKAGHIELLEVDKEGEEKLLVLFDSPEISQTQFMADLAKLGEMAPGVRNSWINAIRSRHPGWYYPF